MILRSSSSRSSTRQGTILIIVLVTIVVLSLSAYTFTQLMQTEDEASRLMTQRMQSKYLCDSGVDYVRLFLSNNQATIREKGGIWDNPERFQNISVLADPLNRERVGRFTVISSSMDEIGNAEGFRYGLMDECNKLNINSLPILDLKLPGAGRQLLMALPAMTEDVADAILDWIDADDEQREFGVETSYYNGSQPPYDAKNGPMDSIDELLLVRNVTPQLLFGLDINRNGIIDPDELMDSDASSVESDMLLGWANYMTLFSRESNLNPEGLPKININNPDLDQLYTDLRSVFDENWTRFIINYRINGPAFPGEEDPIVKDCSTYPVDLTDSGSNTFNNVLDLVGVYTTGTEPTDLNASDVNLNDPIIQSPVQPENWHFTLPIIMESITTMEGDSFPGRINIMQAPRRILAGIPGMTDEYIDQILKVREFELGDPDGVDKYRKYETWLLVDGIVNLPTMRDVLLPFVCTGGAVYRAEIVGYFDDGVATSRAEAVLDTTVPLPRILFWRDKSHLQGGYSIDVLGIDLIE